MTAFSSIWAGSGSCTRMPCTAESSASFFTSASRASCVVSAGRLMLRLSMPHCAQSLIFAADIDLASGVLAHQNDRQAGVDALRFQRFDLFCGLGLRGGGQCLAVNDSCSHDSSLFQMYFFVRRGGQNGVGSYTSSAYRRAAKRLFIPSASRFPRSRPHSNPAHPDAHSWHRWP